MTIKFDRTICCDLSETISREWLVTNGQGGYAAGTIAGVLTRMQHGMLVARLPDTCTAHLLLAKLDEEVTFDQKTYYLGTNEYRNGTFNPSGFVHLESFCLEDGFPIFTYRLGGINGILLEKRIWMAQGLNTTYIQYRVLQSPIADKPCYKRNISTNTVVASNGLLASSTSSQEQQALTITLLPLVTYRPYNKLQRYHPDKHFHVHIHGIKEAEKDTFRANIENVSEFPKGTVGGSIYPDTAKTPYHILAVGQEESQATFIPTGVWYWNFLKRCDAAAGHEHIDDLYLPGVIRAQLRPNNNATLTIVISAEKLQPQLYQPESIAQLYNDNRERQRTFQDAQHHHIPITTPSTSHTRDKDYFQHLLHASEHFLVHPAQKEETKQQKYIDTSNGKRVCKPQQMLLLLSDYYSMENKTRDALIALPGLLLVTGKYTEAQWFLQELADYFIDGILPDRLPTDDNALTDHDYCSVDTTLWYFYALNCYLKATQHYKFLEELFPQLTECINCYIHGTHNGIHCDPIDGLLMAQKEGKALTWMNIYHDGRPVTPRAGKAVEINALWYHALTLMQTWAERLSYIGHIGHNASNYQQYANHCKHNFQRRFWNAERGYLYDVIDGPEGNDATLRVNQLFVLSLAHVLLEPTYRQQVFETITQHLVTAYGLRTLAPQESSYHSHIKIDSRNPDAYQLALHQGSCWTWLIGPYIDAMLSQRDSSTIKQDTYLYQECLRQKGIQQLEILGERFRVNLLDMCEGIFDGDSPQQAGPQSASLLTTAELLRSYDQLVRMRIEHPEDSLLH